MKIVPKFKVGGMTGVGRTSDEWYNNIFYSGDADSLFNHTLEMLATHGDEYMNWVNKMQANHARIYNESGGASDKWKQIAPSSQNIKNYQLEYANNPYTDYNYRGITNAFNNNIFQAPGKRTSRDRPFEYNNDGLYSSITDFRRILGRKGDWSDENLNKYKSYLNQLGYDIDLDKKDNYYKIKKLPNRVSLNLTNIEGMPITPNNPSLLIDNDAINRRMVEINQQINERRTRALEGDFGGLNTGLKINGVNFLNKLVPNILEAVRLKNTLNTNDRVAKTLLDSIRANQQQPYLTHRLVVGDEATKLAYYRRAIAGQTKAAQPFTSDADRQMAYQMEAKRIGDELKALGDLADNQEIRRTSDESNQHQWANAQRLTDVANYNSLERNKANASRRLIEALKYLADYTSIDNFLMGRQANIERNNLKQEAINDEILKYRLQSELLDDPEVIAAKNELDEAVKAKNLLRALLASEKLQKARRNAYLRFLENYRKEKYGNGIFISKKGSKLTLKNDLLYKTTKDAVEHFRAMSKMTDDSRVKNKSKKIKLISHPKEKTKKYQLGGVAPFAIFRPFTMGGDLTIAAPENASSISRSSSSSDSSEKLTVIEKEQLDLVKKLFSDVKGLPIDVNTIYSSMMDLFKLKKLYGESLTTDDIAGLYLSSMQQLSQVSHSKSLYDEARKQIVGNNALGEFAVGASGNYIVQDKKGKIFEASLELILELGLNPLTNSQLLFMRETNPNMSFREGDYLLGNAANNAVSMPNITKYILELIGTVGSSEKTILGFSEVESDKIKLGLSILAGAPKGLYKIELFDKNSLQQVAYALNFILSSLPDNYKAILDMHIYRSNKEGDSSISDRNLYILSMINKGINEVSKPNVTPITGKAATDKEGNSKDGLEINSAVQLLAGMSSPREFTFNIGNGNSFTGFARVSSINDVEEKPFGADFTYSKLYESSLRKNLDLDNACFGDVPINKSLKDRIIVDNSTIAGVDLPYIKDSNGRIIPDFKLLSRVEEADEEVMRLGINPDENPLAVNAIYAKHNLPIKYGEDNRLTGNYKRFAVILATAIEDVFLSKDGLSSNGTLTLVSDEEEIDKYVEEMKKITGNKNFDLDKPGITIFGKGDKDIYKGSIFIPIIGDLTDAISGSKIGKLTENNYDDYRSRWNTKNYVEPPQLN